MEIELRTTVLTPEDAPLAIFGDGASRAVSELLARSGIEAINAAYCEIAWRPAPGGGPHRRAARVAGACDRGRAADRDGFIPIDEHCEVRGAERVYAAGDATDFSVKMGGIAAQQADTAARAIAALTGAPVELESFRPTIHGMLLTGRSLVTSARTSPAATVGVRR